MGSRLAYLALVAASACQVTDSVLWPTPEPPPPAGSPLGTNLGPPLDYSQEWPFVDAFRTSRAWAATDGSALALDEQGWVRALAAGQRARTLMLVGLGGHYPAGRWVVLWQGQGRLEYGNDAVRDDAASRAGRDVLDVTPSDLGILLDLVETDAADPVRHIRVLAPGGACAGDVFLACVDDAGCADAGRCVPFEESHASSPFHPTFLARLRGYGVIRFTRWAFSDTYPATTARPRPELARFSASGVPVELMIDLANVLDAEPWLSIPHFADDAYVAEVAGLVAARLEAGRAMWIEDSEEIWNTVHAQGVHAREQGVALGLCDDPCGDPEKFYAGLRYHARRSQALWTAFDAALGRSRVVHVLGAQPGNAFGSLVMLEFEGTAAVTDALAVPHAAGDWIDPVEQARWAAMTVDEVLAELRDVHVPARVAEAAEQALAARDFGIDLVAYRGGRILSGIDGAEHDPGMNALFDAVCRDPRMGGVYDALLAGWREAGGTLFVHASHAYGWSRHGRESALEYLEQPRAEAPAYDALMRFAEQNPRWW